LSIGRRVFASFLSSCALNDQLLSPPLALSCLALSFSWCIEFNKTNGRFAPHALNHVFAGNILHIKNRIDCVFAFMPQKLCDSTFL
jgi:hypothetical protein